MLLIRVLVATHVLASVGRAETLDRQLLASRVAAGTIAVDGRLDEPAWAIAGFDARFVQKRPSEGAAPSARTEVAVVFDEDAVMIGVRLAQPAHSLRAGLTRRDVFEGMDSIVVSIDGFGDRRTAYSFGVTAGGSRFDHYHASDSEADRDASFDPVWQAATAITATGWSAELRIPFAQLAARPPATHAWGINVMRYIAARNEYVYWQLIPSDQVGWSSRFGALGGMTSVVPRRRLELVPYVAIDARVEPDGTASVEPRLGGDLRAPVGTYGALLASVLPDFGQVEADPAELNLTTTETVFDDKRPFFVDQRRLFEGGSIDGDTRYFYSRRIGAVPRRVLAEAPPNATTTAAILGAAKVAVRTPARLSAGTLLAVTDRVEGDDPLAPLTGSGIVRAQQQLGGEGSTVGGIATLVQRWMSASDPLAARLPSTALAGGGDWDLRLAGGDLALRGDLGGSVVTGSPAAIALVQQASQRYRQRPDLPPGSFDPSRRSLAGWRGALQLERLGGAHWLGWISGSVVSSGFELDDAGTLAQADRATTEARLTFRDNHAGGPLRRYQIDLTGGAAWNLAATRVGARLMLDTRSVWRNDWEVRSHAHVEPRSESDRLTRGGPLMATPRTFDGSLAITGDPGDRLRFGVELFGITDELGRRTLQPSATLGYTTGDLTVAIEPSITIGARQRQYVATLDGGSAATFGRRYLFGELRRTTATVPIRLGYAVTANLTFDLYAAPFMTSGRYARFGELAAPRGQGLHRYDSVVAEGSDYLVRDGDRNFVLANPDFDQVSMRSTAVMRWEWSPGSMLFVVWQQDSSRGEPSGGGVAGPERLGDAFSIAGRHSFAMKLSYQPSWL